MSKIAKFKTRPRQNLGQITQMFLPMSKSQNLKFQKLFLPTAVTQNPPTILLPQIQSSTILLCPENRQIIPTKKHHRTQNLNTTQRKNQNSKNHLKLSTFFSSSPNSTTQNNFPTSGPKYHTKTPKIPKTVSTFLTHKWQQSTHILLQLPNLSLPLEAPNPIPQISKNHPPIAHPHYSSQSTSIEIPRHSSRQKFHAPRACSAAKTHPCPWSPVGPQGGVARGRLPRCVPRRA